MSTGLEGHRAGTRTGGAFGKGNKQLPSLRDWFCASGDPTTAER
ncbi:hypothetical protein RISK_001425 [Rhodopirellula islandica]|uniref:Uncharacterized protein n=1 Tax=Rhodopirellula islandica TaxID=595434 RepID=A0A0J1EKY1_RHOIS|nr:hypothetical protein RISK_001425 [Rhodopirellula islandica]